MRTKDLRGWTSSGTTYQFLYQTVVTEAPIDGEVHKTYEIGLITRVWSQRCFKCEQNGNHMSYEDELARMVNFISK